METALSSPTPTNVRENNSSPTTGHRRSSETSNWATGGAAQADQSRTSVAIAEPPVSRARASKRKRLTVYLPVSLLERLRNTVYWTRGITVAGLLETALTDSLNQKEHQRGGPFPKRLEELKGGRPKRRQAD